jgi:hypothetical protein
MHAGYTGTRLASYITKDAIHNILRSEKYMYGTSSAEELLSMVIAGEAQLWDHIHEGEVLANSISFVSNYPSGHRSMIVAALGGRDYKLWADSAMKAWRDYAELSGVHDIVTFSRLGWSKILGPLGWKKRSVIWAIPMSGDK